MAKLIKYIILLAVILFIIASVIYSRGVNTSLSQEEGEVVFNVASGESVNQISENLLNHNLIRSKFLFETHVWLTKQQANFQAGEYNLQANLSIKEITDILTAGRTLSKEIKITIIEGWTIKDINKYFQDGNIISDQSFITLAKTKLKDWPLAIAKPEFLDDVPPQADFEGFLFPDTYRIYKEAPPEEIMEKMIDNFSNKLTKEMLEEIERQGKTVYEIITMASIVEKEVMTTQDMKIVAGIFWDRIKNGQPLGSDATLSYILGVNKPRHSIEETKIDSPHNTYKYQGLPPGPIANPGLNAIMASIYPQITEYNYFLNRSDTGETVFSKTFDEHIRNKEKYLK